MRKTIQEIANYLTGLRRTIGQFEGNKQEIKEFLLQRLSELSKETNNDNINYMLCQNLARMTRISGVMLLFQNTPEEISKYELLS